MFSAQAAPIAANTFSKACVLLLNCKTGMADKLTAAAASASHAYTGVTITDGAGHSATVTVTTGTTTSDIASIAITSGGAGFAGDANLSIALGWDGATASAISNIKVGQLTNKATNNA